MFDSSCAIGIRFMLNVEGCEHRIVPNCGTPGIDPGFSQSDSRPPSHLPSHIFSVIPPVIIVVYWAKYYTDFVVQKAWDFHQRS